MFKYTVAFKMKNNQRGVSLQIKTSEDWNIHDPADMLDFKNNYNVVASAEKITGSGSVLEATVVEKTQMLART